MRISFGITYTVFWLMALAILVVGCHDEIDGPDQPDGDLTHIAYQPILFNPVIPDGFPALEQPSDNFMTNDGIGLGRKLFYDPILSIDSTVSCASCHLPAGSFTDNLKQSMGVAGSTPRGSMNLINVGFQYHGLFWDGRAQTLEEQSLKPIEDPIEMGESWDHVELKLRRHPTYPTDFRKAFGIENVSGISRFLAAKALAQFSRSIISGGNTRYERFVRGEIFLEEDEFNGYLMFFDLGRPTLPDAECFHCHAAPFFATSDFFNNGLQEAQTLEDFGDKGLGNITGKPSDNGRFKAPTLRNLVFTAPYMHDGRFQTLEEVVDHYNGGGKFSPNKNSFLYPLHLTDQMKSDLIAFLHTLTDSTILTNPAYQSPF